MAYCPIYIEDTEICIFLDTRNASDFSDRNSIVYGHHMKNGTMFSGVTEYNKQEFYNAHPTILIMTPEQKSVKEHSCFDSEITPAATDRIVTLSTCSYEFDNARFVLIIQ